MFFVFSIFHFRESNQILKDIIYNDDNLCLKKGGVERKTQDANFSLPNKIPNPLLKNGFRIRIPKLVKNWADSGSGLPTLVLVVHMRFDFPFFCMSQKRGGIELYYSNKNKLFSRKYILLYSILFNSNRLRVSVFFMSTSQ